MSTEALESVADPVVETPAATDTPEAIDTSDAPASEVSLDNINDIPDDKLDELIAGDFTDLGGDSEEGSADLDLSASEEAAEDVDNESLDGDEDDGNLDDVDDDTPQQGTLEDLFQPLKANGRELQIQSVEEARRLMQQGIDYSKNMQEFSPYKKAMKLLKSRNALDPEKLDFLLDVAEGKPEAVSKLLKDQELDPYDIDVDAGDNYESNYRDTEVSDNLNEVLDNLPDNEGKTTTLSILSSDGWDTESKRVFFENPEGIAVINEQVTNGQFDQIMDEVQRQRTFGGLSGLSDLDAYNTVGNELSNQGKLGIPSKPNDSTTLPPAKKQKNDAQNKKRKKAGGAPRSAPSKVPNAEQFNPATASDEEVDKFLKDHLRNSA